ncbi:nuclear transport factor 2 family protein [Pantoea sp. BAV 3049]|uniref:nuclear transport factor 2 family protein n=1 Tax=Pantoea sp. BAV 3049 TaxID=2654188 RepID=UPI00131E98E1|nr:nuclear transport factor 2 family protein [Pantoea sp. BAV 3049]
MTNSVEDRLAISDLMTGWIHRDLAEWDRLRGLFHDDGVIEVTWFEGPFSQFIEGSINMGASPLRTKHMIGAPVITFNNHKALVETNAVIVAENVDLKLGGAAHNRFYDWVEKRQGEWRIVKRQSIYDMGYFTFPQGLVTIDNDAAANYPREYAALAYLLEKSGFGVNRVFATKGSALEKAMKEEGQRWLKS